MLEVLTEWTGPQGAGMRTVMYFDKIVAEVASVRTSLASFWTALDGNISSQYSWKIATEGRELDPVTGGIVSVWTETTARQDVGGGAGAPVPDASQVLLRWQTGSVVGRRLLQGRTYVPGQVGGNILAGNLSAAVQGQWQTAINNFLALGTEFGIWHRPKGGVGGTFRNVSTGSVWPELAVQRRRRG